MKVRLCVYVLVNLFSFLYTLIASFQLCLFLSSNQSGLVDGKLANSQEVVYDLAIDCLLLLCFVFTHTLMATEACKLLFDMFDLSPLHRSMYNLVSSWSLKLLTQHWLIVNLPLMWDYTSNDMLVIVCQLLHVFGWLSIFSSVYILDFYEFIGMKQVQFYANSLGCPLSNKTTEARSLLNNMRHPVVIGVVVVLWIVPCMSFDRFLIASVLTTYLLYGSKVDKGNLEYVDRMYSRKRHSLEERVCS